MKFNFIKDRSASINLAKSMRRSELLKPFFPRRYDNIIKKKAIKILSQNVVFQNLDTAQKQSIVETASEQMKSHYNYKKAIFKYREIGDFEINSKLIFATLSFVAAALIPTAVIPELHARLGNSSSPAEIDALLLRIDISNYSIYGFLVAGLTLIGISVSMYLKKISNSMIGLGQELHEKVLSCLSKNN